MIPTSTLIEISFTVWKTPARSAMIRTRAAQRTNIPRTRHLAYYLLMKYAGLTVVEISELFNENKHTCTSGLESARIAIETNFVTYKNQMMKRKFDDAVTIINKINHENNPNLINRDPSLLVRERAEATC